MRIKRHSITNNNIVPIDQSSWEQFLGNPISSVLWENNMTNIGPHTCHLAGDCVRDWIRCCPEPSAQCHYPLYREQFSHLMWWYYHIGNSIFLINWCWALTSPRSKFKPDVIQLLFGVPGKRDKGMWLQSSTWNGRFKFVAEQSEDMTWAAQC